MKAARVSKRDLEERVTLVSPDDEPLGDAGKVEVHRDGRLHRAVSIFVADGAGRLLLQRRSLHKYHSPGQWSNTCCGHPRPDETASAAASRRLREEMRMTCFLRPLGSFIYRAQVGGGLIEHELDHLFVAISDDDPMPVPHEVMAWRRLRASNLDWELSISPQRFTAWLPLALAAARERGWAPAISDAR
jgi:isopentenyl-diphosphate delta-isomerase